MTKITRAKKSKDCEAYLKILALDLATQCGWAYSEPFKKIKSGTVDFKNTPFEGAGIVFLKFERWLQRFVEADLLIVEGLINQDGGQIAQQRRYGGLLAIVQKFGDEHDIPYTAEGVSTIKKFWTGSGKANKDKMVDTARKKGFNPADDNEADALALLHLAIDIYDFA